MTEQQREARVKMWRNVLVMLRLLDGRHVSPEKVGDLIINTWGTLTDQEKAEVNNYVRCGTTLQMMGFFKPEKLKINGDDAA